jgi:hypothetical protein
VAVADLRETQLADHIRCTHFANAAHAVRLQHSALHHAERPGTGPRHAFQKATSVNSVMIVIVQNFILLLSKHESSFNPLSFSRPVKPSKNARLKIERRESERATNPRRSRTCFISLDRATSPLIPFFWHFYFVCARQKRE